MINLYLSYGWALVPLHYITAANRCSCGKQRCVEQNGGGKHPVETEWTTKVHRDAQTWVANSLLNVGIATGAPSGFFVLDEDPDNGGDVSLKELIRVHGDLPRTRTHRTGSGGRHFLFTMPADFEPTNRRGELPAGLDIRGTGGQIVAPPSVSSKGAYVVLDDAPIAEAPAWLLDLIRPKVFERKAYDGPAPTAPTGRLTAWAGGRLAGRCRDLAAADVNRNDLAFQVARDLIKLSNAPWSGVSIEQAEAEFSEAALATGLPAAEVAEVWRKQVGYVGDEQEVPPADRPREAVAAAGVEVYRADPVTGALVPVDGAAVASAPGSPTWMRREGLEVSNPAVAAEWLMDNIGRGKLSGLFKRADASVVVHTPRIGESGYAPAAGANDDNGPAEVRPMSADELAAAVQFTWSCYREKEAKDHEDPIVNAGGNLHQKEDGTWVKRTPTMFPAGAARVVINARHMAKHLRVLRGVVHTPVVRADGSILDVAGYDAATRLALLPDGSAVVPPVPDAPTVEQVQQARDFLLFMIEGFPFVTDHDRAAYLGLLLTPLLRDMIPPPYKMIAINAHQMGSGKTLLATLARIIHGGVFRAEMPEDDGELRKQVTTILDMTTGPVVHIDNVSGLLKSSTLAGLLTSASWDDRKLGANELARCVNDRVWTLTGNNLQLGGDLVRRTVWVRIDPGMANPETRTGFKIENLEVWATQNRGYLLHALLVLVRAWVCAGRPVQRVASDGYADWSAALNGILAVAGVVGTFDAVEARGQTEGTDDQDWSDFLRAAQEVFGDQSWTARELLARVRVLDTMTVADGAAVAIPGIPADVLPGDLADRVGRGTAPTMLARSLGRYLKNRKGRRVAEELHVDESGTDNRTNVVKWKICTQRQCGS